jgi:biopolymer transport protein ExbD
MRTSFIMTVVCLCAGVTAAAPIRKSSVPDDPPLDGQTLSVNVNTAGALVIPGRAPLSKAEDVKEFLTAQIARIKKVAETAKEEFAPALALGADSETQYARVVELLDLAKQAGFENVSLKALRER